MKLITEIGVIEVEVETVMEDCSFSHAFGTERRYSQVPVSFKCYSNDAEFTALPDLQREIWSAADSYLT